jgi:alkylation response protein AidB-like acyl-CoA dehydrogenase
MIDFDLDDELELIRSTARQFAADHMRPGLRDNEKARGVSNATRDAFAEIGFQGLECPESLGGSGLGALARCLVMEELGAADPGGALALDGLGTALYPLAELGGEDALARFARPILEGVGTRAVLVWTGEGTRAQLDTRGDTLRGRIPWVPAERVDLLVLLDEEGCRVVESGVRCLPLRGSGLRAAGAAELQLEEAKVVAHFRGEKGAQRALARARLYATSLLVGVMRESALFSRQYALDRVAFGKPIAHHQALAFLIADMAIAVDSCRLLAFEAACRIEKVRGIESLDDEVNPASTGEAAEAAATAFLEAAEQAMFVTPNGVQILGGHGFMQDYPVEKMMREARAISLVLGGVELAREHAGRELAEREGNIPLSLEVSA